MSEQEGSTFKVPVTTIKEIFAHPNATALEYAKVYDFNVVVRKNEYKVGNVVVYVPIDSVLPFELEKKLFPEGSKIKLNNSRVKQIKIRGHYSQGMIIDIEDIDLAVKKEYLDNYDKDKWLDIDLSHAIGITKYIPPAAQYQQGDVRKRDKPRENPYFHKYGGIDNLKWYPDLFEEGELVSITEKIHGSNIRFGYVPYVANNLWRKILKYFKLTPSHEWVYGSNNVQLQQRSNYTGFYGEDVYGKVLEKYDAKSKVKPGEIWYGELYGDGIQKNYTYGCKNGEHKLVVFDVKYQDGTDAKYEDAEKFLDLAKERGFDVVPELYRGPFNKEAAKELTKGDSVFVPSQKVREGAVVKPLQEKDSTIGRKLLKIISEKYLDGDQSDFH